MPNILLIGAGAVGQAYGFHLQQGGAEVTFFVREKYRTELAEGLLVSCLSGKHKGSHRFSGYELCTTVAEVAATDWDQVWLCISSPALYGDWLAPLIDAIGQASLIMLQPGMNDYEHVTALVPRERVVYGMITLASFHAPLAGGAGDPAMTWWFPPFSSAPFSGESERTQPIVKLLKRGGMAAKHVRDVVPQMRIGSGILMPVIAALEAAGWQFTTIRTGGFLSWAGQAARTATQVSIPGRQRFFIWFVTQSWVLRLIILLAPLVAPFNLQAMLKAHFVKVGDQTRAMLNVYIDRATQRDLKTDALRTLLAQLEHLDRH
jgi:hypothetical protein